MSFEPPAPPVKPRNNVRTILIVVGIVLVICCGAGVVGGIIFFKGVADATGPAQDAAVGYVDSISKHDYPAAYGHLCGKVKNQVSEQNFQSSVEKTFNVRSYDVVGTNVMNRNGTVTATATVKVTFADGTGRTQIFPMVKEGGEWKVCE